ncbi:hypothetical protein GCM10008915_71530 [Bifidobacterium pullorum subsp. gallinarum]
MEVATSVELIGTLIDENVVQAYYDGINNLKARLASIREDKK